MEWKDLTIKQAQLIYNTNKSITDEHSLFEAQVNALSLLTNKTEDEINSWGIDKFKKELANISFMYQPIPEQKPKKLFRANGRWYFVEYDMQKVSFGQYNEVMEFSKGEDYIVNNLHKIMASIVTPVKWFRKQKKKDHARVSEDMLNAPFLVCHAAAVFFWNVYNASLKIMQPYLVKELEMKGMEKELAEETVQVLLQTMDGYTPQKN